MDFEKYTKTSDFDRSKIYQLVRLSRIPGFKLLKSEQAYLDRYFEIIKTQKMPDDFYGAKPSVKQLKKAKANIEYHNLMKKVKEAKELEEAKKAEADTEQKTTASVEKVDTVKTSEKTKEAKKEENKD